MQQLLNLIAATPQVAVLLDYSGELYCTVFSNGNEVYCETITLATVTALHTAKVADLAYTVNGVLVSKAEFLLAIKKAK